MTEDLFEPIRPISDYPTQEEIDAAVLEYPQFDKSYVWAGIRTDIRNQINQRWNEVKTYCERNFSNEFRQNDKHSSRLWELNCRYLLRQKLLRPPHVAEPDIIANNFVVECVVPMPNGVPTVRYDGTLFDFPTDQISRRATSALVDKLAQLETRLTSLNPSIDYSTTPYVIGIALTQPNYLSARHMNGMDIVEALLMGAGPIQITISPDGTNGRMSVSSQHSITAISGAEIPTAFFQRDEWKKVSAVMWTSDWFPEESDIKVLLNPNANIPLSPNDLGVALSFVSYTKTSTGYTRNQPLE